MILSDLFSSLFSATLFFAKNNSGVTSSLFLFISFSLFKKEDETLLWITLFFERITFFPLIKKLISVSLKIEVRTSSIVADSIAIFILLLELIHSFLK